MSCEEFTDEVGEYIEGTLPFGERIQMWLHAFLCGHCKNYLEQMRDVADLMGEVEWGWRAKRGLPARGVSAERSGVLVRIFLLKGPASGAEKCSTDGRMGRRRLPRPNLWGAAAVNPLAEGAE